MMRRAQAAMEFLMTYGWAILVVLAAIAALAYFGVLSPSKLLPEQTTFQAPISNLGNALIEYKGTSGSDNVIQITIPLVNSVGSTITLLHDSAHINGTHDCKTIQNSVVKKKDGTVTDNLQNGDEFYLIVNCTSDKGSGDRFKSDIQFYYEDAITNLAKPHSGTVNGKVI